MLIHKSTKKFAVVDKSQNGILQAEQSSGIEQSGQAVVWVPHWTFAN